MRLRELRSDLHLHTAMIDRRPIVVFQGAELIGSGMIAEVTKAFVKIDGDYYMRFGCKFYLTSA